MTVPPHPLLLTPPTHVARRMERVAGQKLKNNMVANTSKKKWEVVGEICSVVFGAVGVILMVLGYFRICNKFITLDDRVTDLEIARTLGK